MFPAHLPSIVPRLSTPAAAAVAVAGLVVVGAVDLATGTEIHVTSLYFLPLALAGWRLPRRMAALCALLATAIWSVAQRYGGATHWTALVWVVNLATEGLALLTVTLLTSLLGERLRLEQAAARFDALTGLRNRRALIEEGALLVELCRRHARPVAVALLDLDHFKQVNDRFGHARGDEVLVSCARIIATHTRTADVAARIGGDEFVVLMPETTAPEACVMMERVRSQFATHAAMRDTGVTATIGVLGEAAATLSLTELLGRADSAMYRGKQSGRDRVVDHSANGTGG